MSAWVPILSILLPLDALERLTGFEFTMIVSSLSARWRGCGERGANAGNASIVVLYNKIAQIKGGEEHYGNQ